MRKKIILLCSAMILSSLYSLAQTESIFTYKVGQYEVILLSEGQNQGKPGVLVGATPEMIAEAMPNGTYPTAVNTFLVKMPDKNVLVDTGVGSNLLNNLKTVGLTPADIHTVIITHMHGDHTGGLIKDGENVFAGSKLILGEEEHNYWSSEAEMNKVPENRRGGFRSAQNVLKQYADNLEIVKLEKLGEKRGDGIFFIEAYGHTPGHTACLVQSGKDKLLIWADLTHVMAIQMAHPEIAVTYDVIPELAIKSRKEIMEYVTKNKIPVAGMHIPYPGIGKVEAASGSGYKFIPAK